MPTEKKKTVKAPAKTASAAPDAKAAAAPAPAPATAPASLHAPGTAPHVVAPRNPDAKPTTVSIVTTCKGRLHHLKQTLPLMVQQGADEVIVVDYDCPEKAGDWVAANFPGVKVVRGGQPDGRFNVARARNLGAGAASGEWLYFVDADILLRSRVVDVLRQTVQPRHFYQPIPRGGAFGTQIYGTFICARADFARIRGYDEVIQGWGREDKDLYLRLGLAGVIEQFYEPELLAVIGHGDAERNVLDGMQHRWHNEVVNSLYSEAKLRISAARGGRGNLPLEDRQKLIADCRRLVDEWYAKGADKPLQVRFFAGRFPGSVLASRMWLQADAWITMTLYPKGRQHGDPAIVGREHTAPPAGGRA